MREPIIMNDYSVYLHRVKKELTGHDNDRVYIGITKQKPILRWQSGRGYKENPYFWNTIQKYGWNNIEHKILLTGLTPEEAGAIERELIKRYDSMNPKKGYNLTSGGDNILGGVSVSDVTRKKHSASQKKLWENEEFRKKMSGDNCHLHVHKFVFYGKDNVTSQKTILLNTGEIFDCQRDAAKAYNVGASAVNKFCRGITRYGGKNKTLGYLVWMSYNDYIELSKEDIDRRLLEVKRIHSNSSKKVFDTKNKLVYPTSSFLSQKLRLKNCLVSNYIRSGSPINGIQYVYLKEYCKEHDIDEDFLLQICTEVW